MKLTQNDLKYIIHESAKRVLNEISIRDAYARFYQDIPEGDYNIIVGKSNVMRLSEADLRYIVSESMRRVCEQSDKEYPKVGAYTIVPDMGSMVHRSVSLKNFGWHNYILMYYSDEHTYCLMQREDNGKFFYTEIVDAPELGEKETKFIPVSISDIPAQIHHDAQLRLRK